ncbi:MAG: hypothetical protein QMD20_02085 [Candidatus Bathyarchaeia archaeon]|nr:hypothetical protein [Candidatus Bathyarchaeia archaeon]
MEHAEHLLLPFEETQLNAVAIGNVDNESDIEIVMAGSGRFIFPLGGWPPRFAIQKQGLLLACSWNGSTLKQKAFTWNGDFEHDGATATTTLFIEKASSLIALTMSNYVAR